MKIQLSTSHGLPVHHVNIANLETESKSVSPWFWSVSGCLGDQWLQHCRLLSCWCPKTERSVWSRVWHQLCCSRFWSTNGLWVLAMWNYRGNILKQVWYFSGTFLVLLHKGIEPSSKGQTGEVLPYQRADVLSRKGEHSPEWCIIHCSSKVKMSCECSWMWNSDGNY